MWNPSPMMRPALTRTAPTIGFGCASATPRRAKSRARCMYTSWDAPVALVEEGVDIGLGVEGNEVVDFFAGADETDGKIQFAGDGHDDAAFGGAVELGQDDAGDAGVAPEFAGLIEAVLPGSCVENQENIVRRAGDNFCGGAFHFVQLGHQIGFGVEAAGGVYDDDIGGTGARGGNRVEDNGGGISAGLLFYDFHAGTVRPDFQLLDGCGAESVSGAQDYACAFFFQAIGELPNSCGLAGAVHSYDEYYARCDFG